MRWDKLQVMDNTCNKNFPNSIIPAMVVEGMSKSLQFGVVNGMPDESEFVRYGAASLRTGAVGLNGEKVSVGCLVKIEMNVQSNQVRVTAHALPRTQRLSSRMQKSLLFKLCLVCSDAVCKCT